MSRPGVGNPGNKGNSNAKGRPGIKETIWHKEKWELDQLVEQLETKIASKVYSIRDVWLLKALKGNDAILKQAADKILADLHDVRGDGGGPIVVQWLSGKKDGDNNPV